MSYIIGPTQCTKADVHREPQYFNKAQPKVILYIIYPLYLLRSNFKIELEIELRLRDEIGAMLRSRFSRKHDKRIFPDSPTRDPNGSFAPSVLGDLVPMALGSKKKLFSLLQHKSKCPDLLTNINSSMKKFESKVRQQVATVFNQHPTSKYQWL